MLSNPNYVKKVVFPLEILCISAVGEGLFQAAVSLCVLLLGNLLFLHSLPWTIAMLPLVLIPAILLILGLSWFLASFGVFVRDVAAGIGVVTMMLFFMTPILYPVSMVPERFRFYLKLNPLAVLVDTCRRLVMWGQMPEWYWLAYATAVGLVCFCFGFGATASAVHAGLRTFVAAGPAAVSRKSLCRPDRPGLSATSAMGLRQSCPAGP